MSWAEIKKAVNSDVGTPLNTLITNAKTQILNSLTSLLTKDQTSYTVYVPSSTQRLVYFSNVSVSSSETSKSSSTTFTASYDGTVRMYYSGTGGSSYYPLYITIYESGGSSIINQKIGTGSYIDFNVDKGKSYTCQINNNWNLTGSGITVYIAYNTNTTTMPTISTVRKVQRGTFQLNSSASTVSISLSGFKNAEKMVVHLYGGNGINGNGSSSYYPEIPPWVESLTYRSLVIGGGYRSSYSYLTGSYEVIEYY